MNRLRVREAKCRDVIGLPLNEVDDVSPLITAADLANATVVVVQVEVVVRLETLVREFGEAHAVFRVDSLVHTILCQHALDAHVPTHEGETNAQTCRHRAERR